MTSSSSKDVKRIKQVKVNFNNYEFNEFNKIVDATHSDRSSTLRNTFFKYEELKKYTSDLKNSISRIKGQFDEIHSRGVVDYQPAWTGFEKAIVEFSSLKDKLAIILSNYKQNESSKNINSGDNTEIYEEFSRALNTLQNAMLILNQAEEVFDKGFFLNKEALAKIIDSNNLDIDDETGEKPININNKSSKNIVILDVSGSDQKYELIDQLNSGNPIISDFKKLNSTNVEETLEFEFINGGVYALDASKQKLSDSMYLFSPKEINIENQGEDIK